MPPFLFFDDPLRSLFARFYSCYSSCCPAQWVHYNFGSDEKEDIHRYISDQEMYETCDVVIEMIDGGFWQGNCKKIFEAC